jgi:hypothetical protein
MSGFGLLELGFMRLLALAARPTTHQNKAAPDQDMRRGLGPSDQVMRWRSTPTLHSYLCTAKTRHHCTTGFVRCFIVSMAVLALLLPRMLVLLDRSYHSSYLSRRHVRTREVLTASKCFSF